MIIWILFFIINKMLSPFSKKIQNIVIIAQSFSNYLKQQKVKMVE